MNIVQVSIGGRAVLVPVTTIGGLATGMGAIANALQACRSLDSGENPCSNTPYIERGAQHARICRTIKQPDQKQLQCL